MFAGFSLVDCIMKTLVSVLVGNFFLLESKGSKKKQKEVKSETRRDTKRRAMRACACKGEALQSVWTERIARFASVPTGCAGIGASALR